MDVAFLATIVVLPFAAAVACARVAATNPRQAMVVSTGASFALATLGLLATVDSVLPLVLTGRELRLTPMAQLGIQLQALAILGLFRPTDPAGEVRLAPWLPVAWLSVAGMSLGLLMNSLSLGLLAFIASAMLWAFGLPAPERARAAGPVLRFAALLALVMPLLLLAFALAEQRTGSGTPDLEIVALALAAPGYGLILGIVPMHAWTLSLAGGAPREMLLGVLALVQTTAAVMLMRTLEAYPWIAEVASTPLLAGGTISVIVGSWLAFASRLDDPDDWLVHAAVAHSGMLLVGLGTQSHAATVGVLLFVFVRVLALVTLASARRTTGLLRRIGFGTATLAMAGTPGFAGFPGLWLVLRHVPAQGAFPLRAALLVGSGLLFATAVRHWRAPATLADDTPVPADDPGARVAVWVLVGLLVGIGLAPQTVVGAFERALHGMFIASP